MIEAKLKTSYHYLHSVTQDRYEMAYLYIPS